MIATLTALAAAMQIVTAPAPIWSHSLQHPVLDEAYCMQYADAETLDECFAPSLDSSWESKYFAPPAKEKIL